MILIQLRQVDVLATQTCFLECDIIRELISFDLFLFRFVMKPDLCIQEEKEYVDSILEDVRWIQSGMEPFTNHPSDDTDKDENYGPWCGSVRKTSDYFDFIYDCAVALIKSGDAYVDSLSAEEMKEYRGTLTEVGKDSPYKWRSIDENLDLFEKVSHFPFLIESLHLYGDTCHGDRSCPHTETNKLMPHYFNLIW